MGMHTKQENARDGAVEQLKKALEVEDETKKDFHLKQALQLLTVAFTDA